MININSDGTFTNGEFSSGLWVQVAGMFLFTFNNSETTYSGNLAGKSITGIQTTFAGLEGCFYMLKSDTPTSLGVKQKADASGKM